MEIAPLGGEAKVIAPAEGDAVVAPPLAEGMAEPPCKVSKLLAANTAGVEAPGAASEDTELEASPRAVAELGIDNACAETSAAPEGVHEVQMQPKAPDSHIVSFAEVCEDVSEPELRHEVPQSELFAEPPEAVTAEAPPEMCAGFGRLDEADVADAAAVQSNMGEVEAAILAGGSEAIHARTLRRAPGPLPNSAGLPHHTPMHADCNVVHNEEVNPPAGLDTLPAASNRVHYAIGPRNLLPQDDFGQFRPGDELWASFIESLEQDVQASRLEASDSSTLRD